MKIKTSLQYPGSRLDSTKYSIKNQISSYIHINSQGLVSVQDNDCKPLLQNFRGNRLITALRENPPQEKDGSACDMRRPKLSRWRQHRENVGEDSNTSMDNIEGKSTGLSIITTKYSPSGFKHLNDELAKANSKPIHPPSLKRKSKQFDLTTGNGINNKISAPAQQCHPDGQCSEAFFSSTENLVPLGSPGREIGASVKKYTTGSLSETKHFSAPYDARSTSTSAAISRDFRKHVVHKRNKESASTKITSYISTSADIFDATRRDLTSTVTSHLRKSAESASKVGKAFSFSSNPFVTRSEEDGIMDSEDSGSDSDESFFCVGEKRRLSGTRQRCPWVDGIAEVCRVCGKRGATGLRSLCMVCRKKLPRSGLVNMTSEQVLEDVMRVRDEILRNAQDEKEGGVEEEEEINSMAPLDVEKATHQSRSFADCFGYSDPFLDEYGASKSSPPLTPPKPRNLGLFLDSVEPFDPFLDEYEDITMSSPHQGDVVPRKAVKHVSQMLQLEATTPTTTSISRDEEDISLFERWQSRKIREEYARLDLEHGGGMLVGL
jgi:hypothetical protein